MTLEIMNLVMFGRRIREQHRILPKPSQILDTIQSYDFHLTLN